MGMLSIGEAYNSSKPKTQTRKTDAIEKQIEVLEKSLYLWISSTVPSNLNKLPNFAINKKN